MKADRMDWKDCGNAVGMTFLSELKTGYYHALIMVIDHRMHVPTQSDWEPWKHYLDSHEFAGTPLGGPASLGPVCIPSVAIFL